MNYTEFKNKIPYKILKTTVIFAICISCASGYAQSRTIKNPTSTLASIKFQPPPPPPNRGEPGGRAQGASRGCEPTALVPAIKSNNDEFLWGLTVSERPQFWFSLPRNLTTQDVVEFTLTDNQGKEIYKTKLENINIQKGIVSFTIPQEISPLQLGKTYYWSFSIYCDFKMIEDRPGTVRGSIQRVPISTNLKNQLANAKTPLEKANIYAKNGIWFNALTILSVNMRDKKQTDITSTWQHLLAQVNLEQAASLSITNCCTPATTSN